MNDQWTNWIRAIGSGWDFIAGLMGAVLAALIAIIRQHFRLNAAHSRIDKLESDLKEQRKEDVSRIEAGMKEIRDMIASIQEILMRGTK